MHYKKNKIQLKSQVFTDRKQKNKDSIISLVIYRLLLVSFVVVAFYVFLFSPFLQTEKINISGTNTINSSDIKKEVDLVLGEKYFSILPKNNLLLFPVNIAKQNILNKFKKISSIDIVKKFPNSIDIKIIERKSLLIWCSRENCFLVDEKGYAYLPADFESEDVKQNNLLKITDESGRKVELNSKIIQDEYIGFILESKNILKQEADIEIDDNYLIPSPLADEFSVKTNNGTLLKISTQIPLQKVLKNMQIFFQKKESPVTSLDQLEYIDLRNEYKIFYKIKNSSPEIENLQKSNDLNVEVKNK
jgi:cell division septal protein FtsQ